MRHPDQVDASEIGTFTYSQEAWRREARRKQEREDWVPKPEQKAEQKKWWARVWEFCQASGRLRAEREWAWQEKQEREQEERGSGVAKHHSDSEEARQQGSKDHDAWRTVALGWIEVRTWAGWAAAGAAGLGVGGLVLGQLGLPVPRGPLGYANLVVEGASALLVSALVVFVETWCWWYRAGFGLGWTLSADDITLRSPASGLVGRPDRIVLRRGHIIPEEKKPKPEVYDSYEAQLGAYFVLIEECFGKRPPYGFLVLGTGRRRKIKNTEGRRNKVKATAEEIRAARTNLQKPRAGADKPGKCKECEESPYCTVRPSGA